MATRKGMVKKSASTASKKKLSGTKIAPVAKASASKKIHTPRCMQIWKTQILANPNVRQMLINLAGEHTLHVISEFQAQMSDEEIAKKTKLRTSDVRVVLNKLHSCGLVSYSRSRDKNSGWYSYVWKMNNDKARDIVGHLMQGNSGEETVMDGEDSGENYHCSNCEPNRKVSFEEASDLLFKCSGCGSDLQFVDSDKK